MGGWETFGEGRKWLQDFPWCWWWMVMDRCGNFFLREVFLGENGLCRIFMVVGE